MGVISELFVDLTQKRFNNLINTRLFTAQPQAPADWQSHLAEQRKLSGDGTFEVA